MGRVPPESLRLCSASSGALRNTADAQPGSQDALAGLVEGDEASGRHYLELPLRAQDAAQRVLDLVYPVPASCRRGSRFRGAGSIRSC